jgi:hypothetical protein
MEYKDYPQQSRSFTEHLVFVALLIPTFIVLGAAVVSLAAPDPSVAVEQPIVTAAACEPCPRQEEDYLP